MENGVKDAFLWHWTLGPVFLFCRQKPGKLQKKVENFEIKKQL